MKFPFAIALKDFAEVHALIVTAHPNSNSLTHAVADRIASGIAKGHCRHSSEIVDLAAEAFDPRFTQDDLALMQGISGPTAIVAAEHARIDRADALILVYPVYWWSMPALLKGWIDKVFTNGWAYDDRGGGRIIKKLGRLNVHLIAIGGADMRTYARHGYFGAMRTQIDHGIFGYCGAKVVTSELFVPNEANDFEPHFATADKIGSAIFAVASRENKADAA